MKPFFNNILNFWANWADSGIQWQMVVFNGGQQLKSLALPTDYGHRMKPFFKAISLIFWPIGQIVVFNGGQRRQS
jgi:hypothetical protein